MKRLSLIAATLLLLAAPAHARSIAEVDVPETLSVDGKSLKCNGAGIRKKFIVKVYAAGLYLPEKKNSVPEVLKVDGPRRMTLVVMREISSDDFGQAFMTGLNNNIDKTEKNLYKNSNQIEYDIYTALNERREISMFV